MKIIYSLSCPLSKEVKYVGITKLPLGARLYQHIKIPVNKLMAAWIKELSSKNLLPIIKRLDSTRHENDFSLESKWIQHFLDKKCKLLNSRLPSKNKKIVKEKIMGQSLKTRMSLIKDQFPCKQYMNLYQYKFGVIAMHEQKHISRVWNLKVEDKEVVENFEKLLKDLTIK